MPVRGVTRAPTRAGNLSFEPEDTLELEFVAAVRSRLHNGANVRGRSSGGPEPGQRLLSAQNLQGFKQRQADRAAGDRDANRRLGLAQLEIAPLADGHEG